MRKKTKGSNIIFFNTSLDVPFHLFGSRHTFRPDALGQNYLQQTWLYFLASPAVVAVQLLQEIVSSVVIYC